MVRRVSKGIKVAQINLQNARSATLELVKYAFDNTMDVICVQEPHTIVSKQKRIMSNLTPNFKALHVNTEERFYASILIGNTDIDVLQLTKYTTKYLSAAKISFGDVSLIIVSIYCPPNDDIVADLNSLQAIINESPGERILITGDFNAKSSHWHSPIDDNRGSEVENFILANRYYVVNQPSVPTFSTVNGESYIDLTIVSENSLTYIQEWQVVVDEVQSDHRLITFKVGADLAIAPILESYVTSRYNKDLLAQKAETLSARMQLHAPWEPTTRFVDNVVTDLTNEIQAIQEGVLTRKKRQNSRCNWWTEELDELKLVVKSRRRTLQRARASHPHEVEIHKANYQSISRQYKFEIRKAKRNAWNCFVENDLCANPWGTIYKLAAHKISNKPVLSTIKLDDGTYTEDFADTMVAILNHLIPVDDPAQDTPEQVIIREQIDTFTGNDRIEIQFNQEDLEDQIQKIKLRKAPGLDEVHGIILKEVAPHLLNFLLDLYNTCLTLGYFPESWKTGCLNTILKASDKDPSDLASYRPITLLSEMGKLLERMILLAIHQRIPDRVLFHEELHGFRPQKSTITAIESLMSDLNDQDSKYHVAIFIDIKGAFDNLWWPSLFSAMHQKGLPAKLVSLIRNYLQNRKIQFNSKFYNLNRTLTKGCPQGSVLGPTLWNLVLDTIFDLDWPQSTKIIAYADDISLAIRGNSRAAIEKTAADSMVILANWMNKNKLKISPAKTKYVIFGKQLSWTRNPVIRYNGSPVARTAQIKYLGVILDEKLSFLPHVKYVAKKIKSVFQFLRSYIRRNLGTIQNSLIIIYNGAVLPIASYGLTIWGHRLFHSKIIPVLNNAQAACLRCILGAYSSTPSETLCVIGKILPLDLYLTQLLSIHRLKTNGEAFLIDHLIRIEEFRYWKDATSHIELALLEKWQLRWSNSSKGRLTYPLLPVISSWINSPTQIISRETMEIITSHGRMGCHEKRIGKREIDHCQACGVSDTPTHRIYDCRNYEMQRNRIEVSLQHWPVPPERLLIDLGEDINLLGNFVQDHINP